MDVQMKRGLLEVCVLASLLKEDSYGYRIIRDVSPYVEISESTLYPILRRLEAANLLSVREEPYSGRLRKYYRITEIGRRRVSVFLEEWRSVMTVYEYIREAQCDDKK
ncbi:Transcriptional regulator PadR-like family protein [anaerobic digester metagenome]